MEKTYQKFISFLALITFTAVGIFLPLFTPRAKASLTSEFTKECVGNIIVDTFAGTIIGDLLNFPLVQTTVPTSDSEGHAKIKEFELKECLLRLKDLAIVTAREILKKRLLDQLVDQLVMWIQNPDDPRIVSDFGDIFENAINAGVGDTLREIGLGELCSEPLRARLELSVRRPQKFSQAINCTLDQVIGNVSAFRDNFANGGWIGYQELMKPQNNIFGLKLLAMGKILADAERKQEIAKAEATPTGFTPQKRCLKWETITDLDGDGIRELIQVGDDEWIEDYYKINNPPGPEDWQCTKTEIITPAKTAADLTSKTTGLDLDYLLSADEAEAYITAISDAIINRIGRETTTGLKGLFRGGESPARGGATSRDSDYRSNSINDAIGEYQRERQGELTQSELNQIRPTLLTTISEASSILNSALGIFNSILAPNTNLVLALDNPPSNPPPIGLIQCQASKPHFVPNPSTFNAQTTLIAAQDRATNTIPLKISEINNRLLLVPQYNNDVINAITTTDLNNLSLLIRDLKSQATTFENDARNLLQEVTDLETTAVNNRDACIALP